MSRWRPSLREGGHDDATVSARAETTQNLRVGAACFVSDLALIRAVSVEEEGPLSSETS
jgi:hypothetical protein